MSRADLNVHGVAVGRTGFEKPHLVLGGPWTTAERPSIDLKQLHGLVVHERGVLLPWKELQLEEALVALKHIEYLHIEYDSPIRLPSLQGLRHLRKLHIYAPKLLDPIELGDAPVREANVWWSKNFAPLLRADLEQLTINRGWTATDCQNLTSLTQLRKLELLYPRKLESLAGVDELSELASLTVHSAPHLEDIRALATLSQLSKLRIEKAPSIRSISVISQLKNLETLSLADCGTIESLTPIASLPKLKELTLYSTRVADGRIAFLRSLPALSKVHAQQYGHYDDNWKQGPF